MDSLQFIIMALAVHRAALLVTKDEGPFSVFLWLRLRVGIDASEDCSGQETALARGWCCIACVGTWIAFLMGLLYWVAPIVALGVAVPLAWASLTLFFERLRG